MADNYKKGDSVTHIEDNPRISGIVKSIRYTKAGEPIYTVDFAGEKWEGFEQMLDRKPMADNPKSLASLADEYRIGDGKIEYYRKEVANCQGGLSCQRWSCIPIAELIGVIDALRASAPNAMLADKLEPK